MKKGVVPSNTRRLGQSSSLFQAVHEHVVNGRADNYDRQKEILKEDLKYHHDIIGERPPFSNNANHGWKKKNAHFGTINHPSAVLAENPPIPPREDVKKEAHWEIGDRPWNPSGNKTNNKRVHDFLGPYPEFRACPYTAER